MKKFTKEELVEMSKDYKKGYPKAKVMFATEDGNFFLAKNPAPGHAKASKIELFEIDMVSEEIADSKNDDPIAIANARVLEIDFDNEEAVDYNEIKVLL